METKTQTSQKVPLYRKRTFWASVLVATVVAAGVALFFLSQDTEIADENSPSRGKVEIFTDPNDATILVDGKEHAERSDASFSLPLGKHEITLQLAGYDEAKIDIEVSKAQPAVIEHSFTKQGEIKAEAPEEFKTYRSSEHGFSIRYPSRWKVQEESSAIVVFVDTNPPRDGSDSEEGEHTSPLTILTQANPKDLSPEAWYKDREEYPHEDQSQIKKKKVTINGRPGYQYETPYGFAPYLITVVTGNNKAFLFQQSQGSQSRALYDQALQSFTL